MEDPEIGIDRLMETLFAQGLLQKMDQPAA
jgi:hypothetical protein